MSKHKNQTNEENTGRTLTQKRRYVCSTPNVKQQFNKDTAKRYLIYFEMNKKSI